jgi:hypothetical protein
MLGNETISSLLSSGIDPASDALTPAQTAATPDLPHRLAVNAMFDHSTTARNTPVFIWTAGKYSNTHHSVGPDHKQ